ncbi:MAG: hypothetical protein E5Y89_00670 [Mesorhizobium sp.]|nr:MAG: hypothetical protein E5Y89_00670 [Mesorhizobium sp.]
MAAWRIYRNEVADLGTKFFGSIEEAKAIAIEYTPKERVVIIDNNTGQYERCDSERGEWVKGTGPLNVREFPAHTNRQRDH